MADSTERVQICSLPLSHGTRFHVIPTGMADRQKITFHQEGDQVPGLEPGDIVIVLDQKEHPVFQRCGNDLVIKREIDLVDALCGYKQVIQMLDNRRLLVSSQPGRTGAGLVGSRRERNVGWFDTVILGRDRERGLASWQLHCVPVRNKT